MKKLIITLLFLLLSYSISFAENQQLAWMGPVIAGSVAASVSCTYLNATAIFDDTATDGDNAQSGTGGALFNFTSSTTVTGYKAYVTRAGTTGNIKVSLYTNSGSDEVGTIVEGTSVIIPVTDIDEYGTITLHTFTLATPKTGITGKHWLIVEADSGATVAIALNIATSGRKGLYADTNYTTSYLVPMAIYGCTE